MLSSAWRLTCVVAHLLLELVEQVLRRGRHDLAVQKFDGILELEERLGGGS